MVARTCQAHFSRRLFEFLRELRDHNERGWFQAHRDRYLADVRDPMLRFVEDLAPRLRRVSRHLVVDPAPVGGSMFRIHRDMRFARDGRPYRTAATARFPHERGREVHAPGFYLHLGADECYAGAGIRRPAGPSLTAIREHVVEHEDAWRRLARRKAFRDGTLQWGGDSLRRPPRGFDAEHPLIDLLRRKELVVFSPLDEASVCRPDFMALFVARCRAASPLTALLAEAIGVPW